MRIVGMIVLFSLALIGQDLKPRYDVSQDRISSRDLFPQAPDFYLASFGEKFELEIPSKQLQELFVRHGFPIEGAIQSVKFVYVLPWDAEQIKQEITKAFKKKYSAFGFELKSINLKPLSEIKGKKIKLLKAQIEDKMLKKNRFLVSVEIEIDSKRVVYPFLCEVDASLEVYLSTQEIRSGEEFSPQNTHKQRIKFEEIPLALATFQEMKNSSARSYIGKDQILFSSKLKPKIIVKKGDFLDVIYREENLVLEARLEAMENGSLNQEILVRNPQSKKMLKVRITAEGKAVLK